MAVVRTAQPQAGLIAVLWSLYAEIAAVGLLTAVLIVCGQFPRLRGGLSAQSTKSATAPSISPAANGNIVSRITPRRKSACWLIH